MSEPSSLFEPVEGGGFAPTAWARGPWSPDALHGGPVAALLAGAAEACGDEATPSVAWQPARLSVELLRPVPVAPLAVSATLARGGRKVQLVDAELRTADATVVASARLLRLRVAAVDAPVTTDVPPPPPPEGLGAWAGTPVDAYEGFHNRGVEHRFAAGSFDVAGPATDWIRLRVPVVPDAVPTSLQRVAAAADFGNGISRVADFTALLFINPDLTIHLHRPARGEWVCIESTTWMDRNGLALAESRLWDGDGPIGRSLQTLLVDGRTP